ncbi:peptide ABC transporter permease [Hypericibacter terrae]|uniref:Peptide ABC transporter permease n=1 Tax=Hypericibacter terrae TaxID=2602015 RepID=A0A5J6MEE4_9PROT|nr:ABC transporter permease subunit [Hypericibacter terrae]QEX15818.1 peptide ABC transporter permease [Hypericibacter terrae]
MIRFVTRRVLLIIPTFFGAALLAFALIHAIPGDPIQMLLGEKVIDPARHAEMLRQIGLDRPLYVQFLDYIRHVLQGDFGKSIVTKNPVLEDFFALFPATLELAICAMVFAVVIAIPAGVLAAEKRGSVYDHALMGTALTGYSMPIFWWGLLLILLFSVHLHWTPVSGRISLDYYFDEGTNFMLYDSLMSDQSGAFISAVSHLILPSIVLGTIPLAVIARMTRSSMLEVLGEDYVRTARAKGLSRFRVVGIHALRNALIPVVTVIGLQVGTLMGGAILTENIFSWPGVGSWLVNSIYQRDYPAVQGGVLLIAGFVILVNLSVDLIYGLLNPRIRGRQ